ncbi:hypothetical protein ILUMI_04161 [Ignelater luminosus]|uniref:Uncharacterized protein n=1 Tax=Ignelater luminosus TaxID=2038154 RepID=A0A8K0GJA0_IGNLU|nr:hypothetical protein ILUMI_04161 [Ignelater luminosus]
MKINELVVLICLFVMGKCGTVPSYIHVCYRDDPQLSKCITNSIIALLPRLRVGIPELNVPPLEPLALPGASLDRTSGSTHFKVNLSNTLVTGASEFTILELKPKVAQNYFRFKVNHPKIYYNGDHNIDSKILFLELKGNGKYHLNITNFAYECILKGDVIAENGTKHLKFQKMEIKIGFESATILLENLFNGDPVLGKAANDAINDNIGLFFEELRPNFEQVLNSVNALVPRLKVGIPELNVPSLDPLILQGTSLDTSSGSTHLKVKLANIQVTGASDFTILEITPKVSKNYFRFKVNHPNIYVEGDYEIDSKILILELKGKGRFHLNITDFAYDSILKGEVVTENGVKHLKFEKMKMKIGFGSGNILLENLFNGDPVLGKGANDAINDNIGTFFEELRPNFEDVLSTRFTDTANKITETFEYEDLFPKSS